MTRRRNTKAKEPALHDIGLLNCLKTNAGRAFLWSMLEGMGCYRMSADLSSGPLAPYATYFREGERSAGNKLLARIQAADPNGYLLMQREAITRQSTSDDTREQRRASEFGAGVGNDDNGHDDDNGSGDGNENRRD